jgi:hypothetical protein
VGLNPKVTGFKPTSSGNLNIRGRKQDSNPHLLETLILEEGNRIQTHIFWKPLGLNPVTFL